LYLAEAKAKLDRFVGRLRDLGLVSEHRREVAPALDRSVRRADRGRESRPDSPVDLGHALIALDRVVDVVELDLEDLSGPEAELDEACRILAQLVELRVVEGSDLGPAIDDHRQSLEVLQRVLVAVVERDARARTFRTPRVVV
jgi:hypothetical protein